MKRILFICSLLTIVATGCKSSRPAAIGFSPDEHGCNAAAGYQWTLFQNGKTLLRSLKPTE